MAPILIMYCVLARQIREGVGAGRKHEMIEDSDLCRAIHPGGRRARLRRRGDRRTACRRRRLRGAEVTFLHLTMGEQGHPYLIPAHYCAQKEEEAARAAARLGVAMRSFGLRDGFLPSDDADGAARWATSFAS